MQKASLYWQIYHTMYMFPQVDTMLIRAYLEIVHRQCFKCYCDAKMDVLSYLKDPSRCSCKNLFRTLKVDLHEYVYFINSCNYSIIVYLSITIAQK